jgi:hypothetical protein
MAYLTATIDSLVKKWLKKAAKFKKQKLHPYDTSTSNSNSEKEIRCRDMEIVVDKCLKLDESFMSDLQSVQPHPIQNQSQSTSGLMKKQLKMQKKVK